MFHALKMLLAAAVLYLGACSAGCASSKMAGEIPALPVLPGTGEAIASAKGALWPLYLTSVFCILGGAILFYLKKDWRLLAVGVGLALVPPVFIMFLQPVAPFVGWGLLTLAVMGLTYVGFNLGDHIRDRLAENRRQP